MSDFGWVRGSLVNKRVERRWVLRDLGRFGTPANEVWGASPALFWDGGQGHDDELAEDERTEPEGGSVHEPV